MVFFFLLMIWSFPDIFYGFDLDSRQYTLSYDKLQTRRYCTSVGITDVLLFVPSLNPDQNEYFVH